MPLASWLRCLRSVFLVHRPCRRRATPTVTGRRPRVRLLEDRTVPSAVSWANAAGGDWDTPSNWSTGRVPGATDDVTIAIATTNPITHDQGYTDKVHSLTLSNTADTLSVGGGKLVLAAPGVNSTISGTLVLANGYFGGPGNLTLDGPFDWTGGTMYGGGTTTANDGITMNGSGSESLDNGRTLINANNGTANWSGTNNFGIGNESVFENAAGSTFNAANDQSILTGGTTGTFVNAGTLNRTTTPGTNNVYVVFDNSGTVNVQSGTLAINTGGASTGGTFAVAAGDTIAFTNDSYSVDAASSISGAGNVNFAGGTVTVNGTYNVTGSTSVSGTVDFTATSTVTSVGSVLNVTSNTAQFDQGFSVVTLNLTGGNLTGAGNIKVTGAGAALNWGNATMAGSGTTTIAAGASLNMTGANVSEVLDHGRQLVNDGTTIWSGTNNLYIQNGAVFTNAGTFNAENDQNISTGGSPGGTFINSGTFTKGPTTGTTTVSTRFNNSGTVNVNNGTLAVNGGGRDTGAFTVAAGSGLSFGGHTDVLTATSSIGTATTAEAGTVTVSAFVSIGGSYNVTGGTTVTNVGGTWYGTPVAVGPLTISGGYGYFTGNVTTPSLSISGGELEGPATVTATTLSWTGGEMFGGGTTVAAAGGTATLDTSKNSLQLDGHTLNLLSTTTWQGSAGSIGLSDNAVLYNKGTLTINGDQNMTGSNATFNNAGTVTKTTTTGTTIIQPALNNSGTVAVNSGTLELQGDGTDTKTFTVASGAKLIFDGHAISLSSTAKLTATGTGSVVVLGGTTYVAGSYSVAKTGSTTVSGGTASLVGTVTGVGGTFTESGGANAVDFGTNSFSVGTFNLSAGTVLGSGTVTVTAAFNWSGGTMGTNNGSPGGTTVVGSAAMLTISGTNSEILDNWTFTNKSAAGSTWSGNNSLYLNDGSVFNNAGVLVIQNDQNVNTDGTAVQFNNSGTLTKSAGSNTTNINAPFNNSGTLNVNSGTVALNGGGTASGGTFNVGSGEALTLNQGSFSFNKAFTLAGAGAFNILNGTITFAGTVDLTGTTTVTGATTDFTSTSTLTAVGSTLTISGGSVNFDQSFSVATLNLSSTLSGTGNVTVTGALNWSAGGTMAGPGTTTVTATAGLTISGSGTEELDGRTFTTASPTGTWNGGNNINVNQGSVFNNAGTLTVQNDQKIQSDNTGGQFNNSGTLTKSGGTAKTYIYAAFSNTGTVNVNAAALYLEAGGSGTGTYTVASGDTLDFDAGTYSLGGAVGNGSAGNIAFTNGATAVVTGTYGVTGSTTVDAASSVEFDGAATSGAFANAGTVTVGPGGTLTVSNADYTQTGGLTNLDGGTLAANNVNVNGGTFGGFGTITGNLNDNATLDVGAANSPATGTLTVSGNYTQGSSASLNMLIGGANAGQFDVLAVGGTATLNGTFNDSFTGGYAPSGGSWTVITAGNVSGTFATVNPPGGFGVHYTSTAVTIQ